MHARLLATVAALVIAACGDNIVVIADAAPLAASSDLTIVAHPEDDLVFLQPDVYDAVRRGGATSVYVTTGGGAPGVDGAEQRYAGLRAAYSEITGDSQWRCGWITIAAQPAEHCRLADERVSLVFLGYPDGGTDGNAPGSLVQLWGGQADTVMTVASQPASYDRSTLVAVVTAIIDQTQPQAIRTLDIDEAAPGDHLDHQVVGALTVVATAASTRDPELISYRGESGSSEPRNADPKLSDRSAAALARYAACATGCAPCGDACAAAEIDPTDQDELAHRYAIGVRRTADGPLQLGDGCVGAPAAGGNAVITDCATAPDWHLDAHGTLQTAGGLCLEVFFTGEITVDACRDAGPAGRFFLDDDGHLWSGATPPPTDDPTLAHLFCVGAAGGRPRAALCGSGALPSWSFARRMAATPRATVGITRAGRAVRIAPLTGGAAPSVCAVEATGLVCATLASDGTLSPATRLDSPAAPLAIEPDSLALGDVDGDGRTDACGRDAGGILCATAASGYQAVRWTPLWGGTGSASPADRSLTIAPDGALCELDAAGAACLTKAATAVTDVRSTWPDRQAALWFGDLDGDGQLDWCAATPAGPACSLAADRAVTQDGIAWGYSLGAVVAASTADGPVPDTDTAALGDGDGDGRADLCTATGTAIACARSLSHGFGPPTPIARLPTGLSPTSVWAAPSGSPVALCAADATAIACTVTAGTN